jgi:D-glycero-alpha-D-manno-heptose-7-phosphate kinase
LPGWYRQFGGFWISASIDKYIYLTGSRRSSDRKIWLSYSSTEVCDNLSEVKHAFFAQALGMYNLQSGIEIHSISEVVGQNGLGSSGSFLVGLLALLNAMDKVEMTRNDLAELACRIEMVDLKRASGKQDQYISAVGGITGFTIDMDGRVTVEPLRLSTEKVRELERNLLIFHTGVIRDANPILAEQGQVLAARAEDKVAAMHEIQKIGFQSRDALLGGDFDSLGRLMDDHWNAKKRMSAQISSGTLDEVYAFAKANGALGGKIMGAGGGGHWLFYVPTARQAEFREKVRRRGMTEMMWRFEDTGCTVYPL